LITADDSNKVHNVNLVHFILALLPFGLGWFVMEDKPEHI
jgi:hypothetical protein